MNGADCFDTEELQHHVEDWHHRHCNGFAEHPELVLNVDYIGLVAAQSTKYLKREPTLGPCLYECNVLFSPFFPNCPVYYNMVICRCLTESLDELACVRSDRGSTYDRYLQARLQSQC